MTPEESQLISILGKELLFHCGGTPYGDELRTRMTSPRVGDLVLEISSFGRPWDPDRLGILLRLEKVDEGQSHEDTRYVVAPLHDPEREQGWLNAEFIALPNERVSKWLATGSET